MYPSLAIRVQSYSIFIHPQGTRAIDRYKGKKEEREKERKREHGNMTTANGKPGNLRVRKTYKEKKGEKRNPPRIVENVEKRRTYKEGR